MAAQLYQGTTYNASEVFSQVQSHLGVSGGREPDIRHVFRTVHLERAKREHLRPYSATQQNYDYQVFLGSGQLPEWMLEFYTRAVLSRP